MENATKSDLSVERDLLEMMSSPDHCIESVRMSECFMLNYWPEFPPRTEGAQT